MYHVLNRAVARLPLFEKDGDYQAFERVLLEAMTKQPTRLLAYSLMPNHWHLVLWPQEDGELTGFVRWLTHTHSMRWHAHYHTAGTGHIYQGRFKKPATMFKSAPAGALYKRGRTNPVNDPDLLFADFNAFDKRSNDLPSFLPVSLVCTF